LEGLSPFYEIFCLGFYVHSSNASMISAEHRPNSHKAFCKQCSLWKQLKP
jgi:hypothetical protein